jgi:hypothetical protein
LFYRDANVSAKSLDDFIERQASVKHEVEKKRQVDAADDSHPGHSVF